MYHAEDIVQLDNQSVLDHILEQLDEMFDGKASAHYIQSRVQNWAKEPFVKGAYSFNLYDMAEMLAPVDERIYFSGEYLAVGQQYQGFVHGAAISGRDVAQRLLLDHVAQC